MNSDKSMPLSVQEWRRREEVLAAFEEAWRKGEAPDLAAFLPAGPEPERAEMLVELLRIEREFRLERGDAFALQDYLARFPELRCAATLADDLGLDASQRQGGGTVTSVNSNERNGTDSPLNAGPIFCDVTSFLAPAQQSDELGRLGTYRVLRVLGFGGMGVVCEAEDTQLQRRVALKLMKPALAGEAAFRQRFLREARAAAALDHDHIVHIYQVGEDRGCPYLAMQLLEGMSLAEVLKTEPRLPQAEVMRIGREIALGLAAAHACGLVHRDIKPGNLWLECKDGRRAPATGESRVKILDFGLARSAGTTAADVTKPGDVVGTPAYMAPEQARGLTVDHRADLFSLGCVLYELTVGRRPFVGEDALAIVSSLAADTPAPPHQIDPAVAVALSDLIMRLLEKDPARRRRLRPSPNNWRSWRKPPRPRWRSSQPKLSRTPQTRRPSLLPLVQTDRG
jgi:serine/threonine protein kinase